MWVDSDYKCGKLLKISKIPQGFIFTKLSLAKIKSSQNGEITLSFTAVGKSCSSCESLMSQICILMLSVKIKFSRKFPNLQYTVIQEPQ